MIVRGKIEGGTVYPITAIHGQYGVFERRDDGEVAWVGDINYDNFKLAEQWLKNQGLTVKLHRVGRRIFPPQSPQ